jgi:hypothetical protein
VKPLKIPATTVQLVVFTLRNRISAKKKTTESDLRR